MVNFVSRQSWVSKLVLYKAVINVFQSVLMRAFNFAVLLKLNWDIFDF